jgi:hypothetical protein
MVDPTITQAQAVKHLIRARHAEKGKAIASSAADSASVPSTPVELWPT